MSQPTPYGDISVAWTKSGSANESETFTLDLTVPVGTQATVYFPVGSEGQTVYDSDQEATAAEGVSYLGYENGKKLFAVSAGRHHFSSNTATEVSSVSVTIPLLKVAPNPVGNTLHWSCNVPVYEMDLYNMSGVPVVHLDGEQQGTDVSHLNPGAYFMVARTPVGKLTTKVIKH